MKRSDVRRFAASLVGVFSRWIRYQSLMSELRALDCLQLKDLGITGSDFDSIARGTYKR
jgi:uncharacterized protein YjiS (DUF1127 family)